MDVVVDSYTQTITDEETGDVRVTRIVKHENDTIFKENESEIFDAKDSLNMIKYTNGDTDTIIQTLSKMIELEMTMNYDMHLMRIQHNADMIEMETRLQDAQKRVRELEKQVGKCSTVFIGKDGVHGSNIR